MIQHLAMKRKIRSLARIFKCCDMPVYHKPINTLSPCWCTLKTKQTRLQSVGWSITSNVWHCKQPVHIGQTERTLSMWVKEHLLCRQPLSVTISSLKEAARWNQNIWKKVYCEVNLLNNMNHELISLHPNINHIPF